MDSDITLNKPPIILSKSKPRSNYLSVSYHHNNNQGEWMLSFRARLSLWVERARLGRQFLSPFEGRICENPRPSRSWPHCSFQNRGAGMKHWAPSRAVRVLDRCFLAGLFAGFRLALCASRTSHRCRHRGFSWSSSSHHTSSETTAMTIHQLGSSVTLGLPPRSSIQVAHPSFFGSTLRFLFS